MLRYFVINARQKIIFANEITDEACHHQDARSRSLSSVSELTFWYNVQGSLNKLLPAFVFLLKIWKFEFQISWPSCNYFSICLIASQTFGLVLPTLPPISVTRWQDYFHNIWSFPKLKFAQCHCGFKILTITNQPFSPLKMPKWRNFTTFWSHYHLPTCGNLSSIRCTKKPKCLLIVVLVETMYW